MRGCSQIRPPLTETKVIFLSTQPLWKLEKTKFQNGCARIWTLDLEHELEKHHWLCNALDHSATTARLRFLGFERSRNYVLILWWKVKIFSCFDIVNELDTVINTFDMVYYRKVNTHLDISMCDWCDSRLALQDTTIPCLPWYVYQSFYVLLVL